MTSEDPVNGLAAGNPSAEDEEEPEERTPGKILTRHLGDPFRVLTTEEVFKVPENELRPIFERLIRECGYPYPGNEAAVRARVILAYNLSTVYSVLRAKGVKIR